jgi:antitoxin component of MazEF toxin-antitoxin module
MSETYEKDAQKIGGSLFVVIPSRICEKLNISDGDLVKVSVEKLDQIVNVRCKDCETIFPASKFHDPIDCPKCGAEILLVNAEIIN